MSSGTITITSTTDSEDDIRAALDAPRPDPTPDPSAPGAQAAPDVADAPEETSSADETPAAEAAAADADQAPEATAQEATADTPAEADQAADDAPPERPAKPRRSPQARIEQLLSQNRIANARAQEAIDRAAAAERQLAARHQAPQAQPGDAAAGTDPTAPVADGKPTQEKFDTYDEYVEALTNWTVEQRVTETVDSRLAAAQDASNRVAAERARAGMLAAHTERVNAARERYADFDAVVEASQDLPISKAMQDTIVNTEVGGDLIYYLGTHPDAAREISQLPAGQQVFALGELAAQVKDAVSAAPTSATGTSIPASPVTRTPLPPKPVGTGSTAPSVKLDDPRLSQREFNRIRNEAERRRLGL